ncbi:peptidoglycan DD-metalloendopeptidase family protein [Streptomyces sp. NPDC020965]|uniref:peptidoglycan DD-metalloendopeptidase family protein n=1 Tax=Streptomyces sp. NPDC020965 TaxID=3365105 RepID=UPI00379276BF
MLFVPVVLCLLPLLTPTPATASEGPDPTTGAEVARLYEEATRATTAYERGRRAAEARRVTASGLQARLVRQRRELVEVRDAVGTVARAQYRTGGPLTFAARLLQASDPEQLMLGRRLARQAEAGLNRLLDRAQRAERELTEAEERARAAWRDLAERTARLAARKQRIEATLERVWWSLQREAERGLAAGKCAGGARRGGPAAARPSRPAPRPPGVTVSPAARPAAPSAVPRPRRSPGPVVPNSAGLPAAAGPSPSAGPGPWKAPPDMVPPKAAWVAPVERYALSAGFNSAGRHWARRHTGQDFAVGIGTPVRSVGAGRVLTVSCGGAFGVQVVVRHSDGYYTQYAHLASVAVAQGDRVRAGQWLGPAGTTGNSTGPHLHFEVRLTPYQGSGVDPAGWLRERGVRI